MLSPTAIVRPCRTYTASGGSERAQQGKRPVPARESPRVSGSTRFARAGEFPPGGPAAWSGTGGRTGTLEPPVDTHSPAPPPAAADERRGGVPVGGPRGPRRGAVTPRGP